jgi:uncharacterized membrane protein
MEWFTICFIWQAFGNHPGYKIISYMNIWNNPGKPETHGQVIGRFFLGLVLITAGTAHLSFARGSFQAQVPDWVPLDKDLTVVLSGIIEIMLGAALAFWVKKRVFWGWFAAIFFTMVFPGNISQWANHRSAFGLTTDTARAIRLFFQPVLVIWALWSTGAWAAKKIVNGQNKVYGNNLPGKII